MLRGVASRWSGAPYSLCSARTAPGKTTVVKVLSTLLKADGDGGVNGFDVAAQPANVRESISLTGRFAAVDDMLTGQENLVLIARLRHLKDRGAIADSLLERFG